MRFFLGLETLPNLSIILFTSKTEKELTWYARSMQENTVFTTEFSFLESDSRYVCFSRMLYLADSLSNFNTHFYTIACRTKTTQDGFELNQVFNCALELYIQCGQGRVEGLQLDLSIYIGNNQDNIPQQRATAVILELDHQILP